MKSSSAIAAALLSLAILAGCDRDQYPGERTAAIERARLPTPRNDSTVADALATAPAIAAHPTEAPTAKAAPKATATVEAKKEAPTPEPKGAPVAVSSAFSPRPGTIGKGTDILDSPSASAEVLGTFQGKTKVEVVAEQGEFAKVKAPTTGGKSVEGWVLASAVKPVEAVAKAPAEPKGAAPKSDKPAEKASAKPAAAKASSGSKGPDDVSLKAIAGMTMKRLAVPFTHKKHYDDYSLKCEQCHHPVKAKGGAVPATKTCTDAGCHLAAECNGQPVAAKNKACPNFEDAYHYNCIECHRSQSGPTKCAECHTG